MIKHQCIYICTPQGLPWEKTTANLQLGVLGVGKTGIVLLQRVQKICIQAGSELPVCFMGIKHSRRDLSAY